MDTELSAQDLKDLVVKYKEVCNPQISVLVPTFPFGTEAPDVAC